MQAFVFDQDGASERPFAEASTHFGQAELLWLHIDGQNPAARGWVEAQADLTPIVRNALIAYETRPRSDMLDGGAIANMRGLAIEPEDAPDPLVSIRFWAEKGRVISFAYRVPVALQAVISEFLAGHIKDPGDLITCFATMMSSGLDPEVARLGDHLDEIEAELDINRARSTRRQVSRIRAEAIGYRRFVVPQREALDRLAAIPCLWLTNDDQSHLREAADRYARMAEELEAVRERAAVVHDELTDLRSERMDGRALLLSIVALIFLPLTFLTGLLGMNVEGIPYAREPWAFWGVVAICILMGIAVIGYFVRARWVERSGDSD